MWLFMYLWVVFATAQLCSSMTDWYNPPVEYMYVYFEDRSITAVLGVPANKRGTPKRLPDPLMYPWFRTQALEGGMKVVGL